MTTSWSRGISRSMFLRLCSRAPLTTIRSLAMSQTYCVSLAGPRQPINVVGSGAAPPDTPHRSHAAASPANRCAGSLRLISDSPRPSHGLGSHGPLISDSPRPSHGLGSHGPLISDSPRPSDGLG